MFRFILFALFIYVVFKVVRFLLRTNSSVNSGTHTKDGDVSVRREAPPKKPKYGDRGEYIDYEEIKQK